MARISAAVALGFALAVSSSALAADKPLIAKVCQNCHQPQAGNLRGTFDNVSFKSKAIQIRLDDAVEMRLERRGEGVESMGRRQEVRQRRLEGHVLEA